MIVVNKPCSVIVLDINGLNFPKKTRTVLESKVHLCATFENHNIKGKHHLGVKEQKKNPRKQNQAKRYSFVNI